MEFEGAMGGAGVFARTIYLLLWRRVGTGVNETKDNMENIPHKITHILCSSFFFNRFDVSFALLLGDAAWEGCGVDDVLFFVAREARCGGGSVFGRLGTRGETDRYTGDDEA